MRYMFITDNGTDYFRDICRPSVEAYCKRHRAELVVSDGYPFPSFHPAWMLPLAIEAFAHSGKIADMVCFLDNDIYISPIAPSIWERTSESSSAKCREKGEKRKNLWEKMLVGGLYRKGYDLNTCNMVLRWGKACEISRCLEGIVFRTLKGSFKEQEVMSLALARSNLYITTLDYKWYYDFPRLSPFEHGKFFYHCSGNIAPGKYHYLDKVRRAVEQWYDKLDKSQL
jgi:hypothetical protein